MCALCVMYYMMCDVHIMYDYKYMCVQEKNVGEGLRLKRLEVARVLRERNEYKEKYLSLLEQVRSVTELNKTSLNST